MFAKRSDPLLVQLIFRIIENSFMAFVLICVAGLAGLIEQNQTAVIDVCVGYENSCLTEWAEEHR